MSVRRRLSPRPSKDPPCVSPPCSCCPFAAAAFAQPAGLVYPETQKGDTIEEQFGERIADPYRWLENDVREDARVRQWVDAQNAVTNRFLATLPGRDAIRARMTELYNYERFGLPEKAGNHYFYTRNDGLQNQAVLYVREGLNGTPRVLIDPNTWSQDGATALAEWDPSEDGRHLLYSVQDGGTDWRIVRVLDVATGQPTEDEVRWVKFSSLDWAKDGSGFFYSRFPEPAQGAQFQSTNENHSVYFHRLGTPQSADRLIYATPGRPRLSNNVEVSEDGNWLIVYSAEGTDNRYEITLVSWGLRADAQQRRLITGMEHDWTYLGNSGNTFYWSTNNGAPRQRIVATDVSRPELTIRQLVPEDRATLQGASIVGRRLIARYLVDAKSEVRTFDLPAGAPARSACRGSAALLASRAINRAAKPSTASQASTRRARSIATTAPPARAASSPSRASPSILPNMRSARSSTRRAAAPGCRCSSFTAAA